MARSAVLAFAAAVAPCLHAQGIPTDAAGEAVEQARFTFVDVYVDAGEAPLAAYQVELNVREGDARIVGVEGGDHSAFREPPYYDPKALTQNRVILAAFSTRDELPAGRTRVTRVHFRVAADSDPVYAVELRAAASAAGAEISAVVSIEQGDALP